MKEQSHLDLLSYDTSGMANVDVCNLTWDSVQEDRIVYERIKFPKTAKPILLKKAKDIMNKYKGTGYENYVFLVFTRKQANLSSDQVAVRNMNNALAMDEAENGKPDDLLTAMLRMKENTTWYSVRCSFISKMVNAGNDSYVVAEMVGDSPLTIYKHYL